MPESEFTSADPRQWCGLHIRYFQNYIFPWIVWKWFKNSGRLLIARLNTPAYLRRPCLVLQHIFLRFMYVSKFIIEYFFDLYLRYTLFVIIALFLIVIVFVVEWKENWVFCYLLSKFVKTFLSLTSRFQEDYEATKSMLTFPRKQIKRNHRSIVLGH